MADEDNSRISKVRKMAFMFQNWADLGDEVVDEAAGLPEDSNTAHFCPGILQLPDPAKLLPEYFCHSFSQPNKMKPVWAVLRIRIRDPVHFWPLDPGWEKNQDQDPGSGSGMNIPDHISESLETIWWVKILTFFDADADPGIFLTLDPG